MQRLLTCRMRRQNTKAFLLKGLWTLLSALFLLAVGAYQLTQLDRMVAVLSVAAIAIGIVPMLFYRWKYGSEFYTAPAEVYELADARVLDKATMRFGGDRIFKGLHEVSAFT